MFVIEAEQSLIARDVPLLGVEQQIYIRIEFSRNCTVNVEHAEQAIILDNLAHFAQANLTIVVRIVKVEAHVDINAATDTGRYAHIDFGRRREASMERKFVNIVVIFVLIRNIESVDKATIVLVTAANELANAKRIVTKAKLDRSSERDTQSSSERPPNADKLIPAKIETEPWHCVLDQVDIFAKEVLEYLLGFLPEEIPTAITNIETSAAYSRRSLSGEVGIIDFIGILVKIVVKRRTRSFSIKETQ